MQFQQQNTPNMPQNPFLITQNQQQNLQNPLDFVKIPQQNASNLTNPIGGPTPTNQQQATPNPNFQSPFGGPGAQSPFATQQTTQSSPNQVNPLANPQTKAPTPGNFFNNLPASNQQNTQSSPTMQSNQQSQVSPFPGNTPNQFTFPTIPIKPTPQNPVSQQDPKINQLMLGINTFLKI